MPKTHHLNTHSHTPSRYLTLMPPPPSSHAAVVGFVLSCEFASHFPCDNSLSIESLSDWLLSFACSYVPKGNYKFLHIYDIYIKRPERSSSRNRSWRFIMASIFGFQIWDDLEMLLDCCFWVILKRKCKKYFRQLMSQFYVSSSPLSHCSNAAVVVVVCWKKHSWINYEH